MCNYLLLTIFFLIPFQKRFHGAVDSFSRKLIRPDFSLPEYFSTKIHLHITDILILIFSAGICVLYRPTLHAFFWEKQAKYLTLFILAALISTYFSITSHYPFTYFRFSELVLQVLFFNSLRILCQKTDCSNLITKLSWTFVFVSLIQCTISTLQYFGQHSLGLSFLGEKNISQFLINSPGKLWFFGAAEQSGTLFRAAGTFSHPNILGGFIFCSILATYYLIVKQLYKPTKIFLLFVLLFQFFTLCISFSRSAIIALVLSSILWSILQYKKSKKMFGLILICCCVCIGLFYPQLAARGGILNYNAHNMHADSERIQYIKIAARMIQEHPLLGVGWNNFQLYLENFRENIPGHFFTSKVHNIYLLITAETGLMGGVLFLMFLLSLLWHGARNLQNNPDCIFLFCVLVGLLFIGNCDFYLLENPHGSLLFFGFSAMLSVVAQTKSETFTNGALQLPTLRTCVYAELEEEVLHSRKQSLKD